MSKLAFQPKIRTSQIQPVIKKRMFSCTTFTTHPFTNGKGLLLFFEANLLFCLYRQGSCSALACAVPKTSASMAFTCSFGRMEIVLDKNIPRIELKVKETGIRMSFPEEYLGFFHTGLQFLFFRRTVYAY